MRKIAIMMTCCMLCACVNISFAQSPTEIVENAWKSRRVDGTENTVWQVQRYKKTKEACSDPTLVTCYAEDGGERTLAQSLFFHQSGKDGVWMNFLAPKKMAKMSAVVRVDTDEIAGSPRYFCRGGALAKRGARQIAQDISEQKSVDRNVDASWAMLMLQTGVEVFTDSFIYIKELSDRENVAKIFARAKSEGLVDRILYINVQNDTIERIDFLNKDSEAVWIVKNIAVEIFGSHWTPTKVAVFDVKKGTASLMQRDSTVSFDKWPRKFDKKSLPCGR